MDIKPQEGFQTNVALSKADITIIGGAAGCGKSFIMLYLPLMYKDDPNLRVNYFRRTQKQIRENGALWDESTKLYPYFSAKARETNLNWTFPSGMKVDFSGIEYDKDLINFQGAQLPYILFDELTQFTRKQFFFMISRNRGTLTPNVKGCLQKPQVFGSCNPDPDSWVADVVSWYIDQETGYPISEREGVIRYFIVIKDKIIWGNTKKEVYDQNQEHFKDSSFLKSGLHPKDLIKSFTFIGGKIYDNKKLLATQPGYLASLMSQDEADQERFLKGNWKVRKDETGIFDSNAIDRMFRTDLIEDTRVLVGYERGKEVMMIDKDYKNNFITCDVARFGRDLCVIKVWKGWTIVYIVIFEISSAQQTHEEIQLQMKIHGVLRHNVCVDQDGVGGDVVALGGYYGFHARASATIDPKTNKKENYDTFKDECAFKVAKMVNEGRIFCICNDATIKIWYKGHKFPIYSHKIKWNAEMTPVKNIIGKQLRAFKIGDVKFESGVSKYAGGEKTLKINSKDEQKEILGHSPDFADNFLLRQALELRQMRKGSFGAY